MIKRKVFHILLVFHIPFFHIFHIGVFKCVEK
jgi:hypothetical protein